jgi:hypothetical protein
MYRGVRFAYENLHSCKIQVIIAEQNKLNSARHNKLKMVQQNKLNVSLHEKLRIVRHNKLTKARELWQDHMKNWPNPLMP